MKQKALKKTDKPAVATRNVVPQLADDLNDLRLSKKNVGAIFMKENILWMIAGAIIIAIGFLLMAGGRSEDPNAFNDNEVYSFRRITLAPIFILAGLIVEIYAIFRNPKR